MDIRKLQRIIVDALVDLKGKDIVVYNTEKLSDQFSRIVIATGTSGRHAAALAENVREDVKKAGGEIIGMEGRESGEYYNLEEIWGSRKVNMKIDPEFALLSPSQRTALKKADAAQPA